VRPTCALRHGWVRALRRLACVRFATSLQRERE
jgi:hypothetical protein